MVIILLIFYTPPAKPSTRILWSNCDYKRDLIWIKTHKKETKKDTYVITLFYLLLYCLFSSPEG